MKRNMKRILFLCFIPSLIFLPLLGQVKKATVNSPDGQLRTEVFLQGGQPHYRVSYEGEVVLEDSPLGLVTNLVNFSSDFSWAGSKRDTLDYTYQQEKIKQAEIHYVAHELVCSFKNQDNMLLNVAFRLSNNDIAFRYELPESVEPRALVVEKELTGFNFSQEAKGFLSPQSESMVGFARTKPSYEEGYTIEQDIAAPSANGLGYTFPALFRSGDLWTLVSETGVRGLYCGSHLSEPAADGTYTIAFPDMTENNGFGSTGAAIGLPATTPWRTITVGKGLKPIVETTIPFDVVEPLYEPSQDYDFGKGTWSWIMWQDQSMNYDDQITYIDLAAQLGYEYILVDAWWDRNIGYKQMEELIRYAASKGVGVFLWYNSNGGVNDAPQTPRNKMNTAIARKKEMKWMQEQGVKGIKVDFFGGDKQETMRLYENMLSDANDFGLMAVFHGATLPRGWERMFPNYVGSEAVLASENLMFSQHANDLEAFHASLHPFIRNAVGSMEFGGVVLNERYNRTNDGGNYRRTTDVFQLATAVLFQNPVQFFALTPNNLQDTPVFAIDFMKQVPTTWDETVFIDGYPGKYAVLARKHGDGWYIAGINAQEEMLKLELHLPMLAGKEVKYYGDLKDGTSYMETLKVNKKGNVKMRIPPKGGVVLSY